MAILLLRGLSFPRLSTYQNPSERVRASSRPDVSLAVLQALKSIFSILDRQTEIDPTNPDAQEVLEMRGDISLKHIHFTYPSRPDTVIFKDFSLNVHAGRSLALVGASGSGSHLPSLSIAHLKTLLLIHLHS